MTNSASTPSNSDTRPDSGVVGCERADADWQMAAMQFGYPPDITPSDIKYWDGGIKLAEVHQRARELQAHRESQQPAKRELTPELLEALEGIIHFSDAVAYRDDTLSVALRQWITRAAGLLEAEATQ